MTHPWRLGATPRDGAGEFLAWAPRADRVELLLLDGDGPSERVVPMDPVGGGEHAARVEGVGRGQRYRYRLHRDGGTVDRADPASRWQPEGVHGPSAVDDPSAFGWTDAGWFGHPLHEQVIYELHIGTFTRQGTFDAAVARLDDLVELGITTVEIMPVSPFAGERNWGYDGVLPYGVQDSYGGPDGLRRFVDACHARDLSVLLDVVYNHFGPEGNHIADFGPYLTERYGTPWGQAVNLDGPGSDGVRRYLVENAARWVSDFHLDGLRLDAVHALHDRSARPFLAELAAAVHAEGERVNRRVHVIAESDANDPRTVRVPEVGGLGLDAQWSDDFHHAVHALLTGEQQGYYADYGSTGDLADVFRHRFVLRGQHSTFREHRHGAPADDVPTDRFVVCIQNHDQVGNRMYGDRLDDLMSFEQRKVAAAILLCSPFVPLLFMGEEYGEPSPFQYFTSHTDPELVEAVRVGRREEFAAFVWQGEAPDPQARETFERSILDWDRRTEGRHAQLLALYRELIRLRRDVGALAGPADTEVTTSLHAGGDLLAVELRADDEMAVLLVNVASLPSSVTLPLPVGDWRVRCDTSHVLWGGPGNGPGDTRSEGTVHVTLPATSAVLLTRARHAR